MNDSNGKTTRRALILGAGGFIGSHLAKRLRKQGYFVKGIDLCLPQFDKTACHEFVCGDLRDLNFCRQHITSGYGELYQLAADMGGAGYLFTGHNDYSVMHNSAQINLNVCQLAIETKINTLFYASSACVYARHNQVDPENPRCAEDSAYPADPDSEYGWEKLFGERLYLSAFRNFKLNVRIARFHNVYGPFGAFNNGREKAPAALCRKVAQAENTTQVEVWGSGRQTRSFLYIDDCLDGISALMHSDFTGPVNIGSEEIITLNDFAKLIIDVSGKQLNIINVEGPVGVNGRSSDNRLVSEKIGWQPKTSLREGIIQTYAWIAAQVKQPDKQAV